MKKIKLYHQTGFILMITISLLGVLSLISITYFQISHQHSKLSQQYHHHVRSSILAYSGYDYQVSLLTQSLTTTPFEKTTLIFDGAFSESGDIVNIQSSDLNSKININDGIKAGLLEVAQVDKRHEFKTYYANALDPYPNNDIRDPIELWEDPNSGQNNEHNYESARSALINLRIRRLLNAYGETHRWIDITYQGNHHNVDAPEFDIRDSQVELTLPTPHFSTRLEVLSDEPLIYHGSADGDRGYSMGAEKNLDLDHYNNGLGDRIIEQRPANGFQNLEEVRDIVNTWAQSPGISLSSGYLNNQEFFDLIKDDLTILSFEDTEFFRLDDETRFGYYQASVTLDRTSDGHGKAALRDLQVDPPDYSQMWLDHSVPLINFNQASFFTRAAILYSITNPSLHCDGATTISPYVGPRGSGEFFDTSTGIESMIASPSIGVGPPIFPLSRKDLEHGENIGRSNHLMSLRDAFHLAYDYEIYIDPERSIDPMQEEGLIKNFENFKTFIERSSTYTDEIYPEGPGGIKLIVDFGHFERSLERSQFTGEPYPQYSQKYARLYYTSAYSQRGEFTYHYLEKILPHLLSCVRRIPGYLGSPLALQSPYMLLQPELIENRPGFDDYLNGEICQLPFYKVEDFVWRFTHPKITFWSEGYFDIKSKAEIFSNQQEVLSSTTIHTQIKAFETKYLRSQKTFVENTDSNSTDSDILIGPEFYKQQNGPKPSPYLGFVGLRDFEGDIDLNYPLTQRDILMTFDENNLNDAEGFHPQIIMNFDPYDKQGGFKNIDRETVRPRPQNPNSDQWLSLINPITQATPLLHSSIEDSRVSHFGNSELNDSMCDLNPFGGLQLTSINHGEFAQGGFNDSLYWRLDPWIGSTPDPIIGEKLSAGFMVFWFQMPSIYNIPTPVSWGSNSGEVIKPESFSHVLVSLNLWEKYEYFPPPNTSTHTRPISLIVGLKNTKQRGLNVFARYDAGAEPYVNGYSFRSPLDGYLGTASHQEAGQNAQNNYLGFWCDSSNLGNGPEYSEQTVQNHGITDPYLLYRYFAHRCVEVNARFRENRQTAPGSWQRVGCFWNFHWDSSIKSPDQLYVFIASQTNSQDKATAESRDWPTPYFPLSHYHQSIHRPNDPITHSSNDPYQYPRDIFSNSPPLSSLPSSQGGNVGMMQPFDPLMGLFVGEAPLTRFNQFPLNGHKFAGVKESLPSGSYRPGWRLNSSIDNLRIWLGPSSTSTIPSAYFDHEKVDVDLLHRNQRYSRKRYYVVQSEASLGGAHNYDRDGTHWPLWVLNPQLPTRSKLLSLGTRIYNPGTTTLEVGAGLTVPAYYANLLAGVQTNNFKSLKSQLNPKKNDSSHYFIDEIKAIVQPIDISQNEHNQIYSGNELNSNFRIFIQYLSLFPLYDGDRQTYEALINQEDLDISWIKEVSIRYIPPSGTQILKWEDS